MDAHDAALIAAGGIGCGVAVIHGLLTQRLMAAPFERLAGPQVPGSVRRLTPMLLQFSTFNWFLGGLALIVAAFALDVEARIATAALVGSSYLYGALGNLWGTRGRHPGWALYAIALILIAYGAG